MFFLKMAQAPVTIAYGNRKIITPKFTLKDISEWGSEIEQEQIEKITEGMDDIKRREYLTFYPSVQPDIGELRRRLRTAPAIERVIRTCLMRADVKDKAGQITDQLTEDEINDILKTNGGGRLGSLAVELADLEDKATVDPDGNQDDSSDPPSGSGKPA